MKIAIITSLFAKRDMDINSCHNVCANYVCNV
jgi:hypothetical protein